ncbi:hypothetical protein DBR06_SOUSAS510255, partial [Sousa chinensis]
EGGSVTIEVLRPCPPPSPPGTQTARQGCEAAPSSGRIRCCTGGPGLKKQKNVWLEFRGTPKRPAHVAAAECLKGRAWGFFSLLFFFFF